MGLPKSPEARFYYRAAKQRFEDAEILLRAGRYNGARYLAGYTVECFLKALIMESVTAGSRQKLAKDFKTHRAHDLHWLGDLYRGRAGGVIPRSENRNLLRVAATWKTDQRYESGILKKRDVDDFFESVVAVAQWADGRM